MRSFAELIGREAEETRYCQHHGPYVARQVIGSLWTKCPHCAADAQEKKAERERALKAFADRVEIAKVMASADIPPRFADRTLESFVASSPEQQHALDVAMRYVSDVSETLRLGRCLVLCGRPGTGKTHIAVGIARRFINAGLVARFTSAMNAIRMVREAYRSDSTVTERKVIQDFAKPHLMILDEVGQQHGTEAEKVTLFDLINARYEHVRPTILISNLPLADVREFIGERAFDRLRENGGEAVAFTWDSYRRRSA